MGRIENDRNALTFRAKDGEWRIQLRRYALGFFVGHQSRETIGIGFLLLMSQNRSGSAIAISFTAPHVCKRDGPESALAMKRRSLHVSPGGGNLRFA